MFSYTYEEIPEEDEIGMEEDVNEGAVTGHGQEGDVNPPKEKLWWWQRLYISVTAYLAPKSENNNETSKATAHSGDGLRNPSFGKIFTEHGPRKGPTTLGLLKPLHETETQTPCHNYCLKSAGKVIISEKDMRRFQRNCIEPNDGNCSRINPGYSLSGGTRSWNGLKNKHRRKHKPKRSHRKTGNDGNNPVLQMSVEEIHKDSSTLANPSGQNRPHYKLTELKSDPGSGVEDKLCKREVEQLGEVNSEDLLSPDLNQDSAMAKISVDSLTAELGKIDLPDPLIELTVSDNQVSEEVGAPLVEMKEINSVETHSLNKVPEESTDPQFQNELKHIMACLCTKAEASEFEAHAKGLALDVNMGLVDVKIDGNAIEELRKRKQFFENLDVPFSRLRKIVEFVVQESIYLLDENQKATVLDCQALLNAFFEIEIPEHPTVNDLAAAVEYSSQRNRLQTSSKAASQRKPRPSRKKWVSLNRKLVQLQCDEMVIVQSLQNWLKIADTKQKMVPKLYMYLDEVELIIATRIIPNTPLMTCFHNQIFCEVSGPCYPELRQFIESTKKESVLLNSTSDGKKAKPMDPFEIKVNFTMDHIGETPQPKEQVKVGELENLKTRGNSRVAGSGDAPTLSCCGSTSYASKFQDVGIQTHFCPDSELYELDPSISLVDVSGDEYDGSGD